MHQVLKKILLVDDANEHLSFLFQQRLPWLIVGLLGGTIASFVVSRFEHIISQNIELAFFIPIIMYMGDAVGEQTNNIYVRNLGRGKVNFKLYLIKESLLGFLLGIFFGAVIGMVSYLWLHSFETSLTVALAMILTITIAPFISLVTSQILFVEKADPALGSGPFATILQEVISLMIYFLLASFIIFKGI
jgi:magnesium transporter